jgi:hypothetical protein
MPETFRVPLVAGAIAAVGAAAVITAPADNADRLAAAMSVPSSAQFALTAWQNPIIALLDSGEVGEDYVFGRYYNGANAPTPGAGEANWPFAGFDQTGGDVLNYLLTQKAELGNYFYVGFLPNFTFEAYLPAVQQWQLNAEDYTDVFLSGLNLAARNLVEGQWAEAGKAVLDATTYVLTNFGARGEALLGVIPQILTTFAGSAIGGTKILVEKTAEIVNEVFASLGNSDWEGAWNAAVDGTLGPSGIPGTLFNLNTGAGVQTGPILNPETDIPDNYVPSIRTSFQAAQWTARVALQTTPTAEAAPAAAAAPVAAAAGELPAVAVPESPATVADDPVGADPVSDITVAAEPAPAAESAPPAETADSADVEADAVKDVTPKRKATKRDGSHRAAARGGNGS